MTKRDTKRIPINREVLVSGGGVSYQGFLSSISENGVQLVMLHSHKFRSGQAFTVTLPSSLVSAAFDVQCNVVWSDGNIIGARILEPSTEYKTFYKQSYLKIKKEITHDEIAVIGMGCYYPGAPTIKSFWENILARRREFRKFPDQRLPLADYFDADPSTPDKMYADRAAFIDGFTFDWIKRGIPKTVVDSTDIVHWLALEVALRALDDAGYTRETIPLDRTGVILGNTLTGEHSRTQNMRLRWPYVSKILKAAAIKRGLASDVIKGLLETMEEYYKSAFAPITEDTLAGNLSNTIAGRICNFLNLHGGGYTVDGACSSSLIAVATAATGLSNGTLDLAICGGCDVSLDTFELVGFSKANALTREDMRVYDRRASGFIPGEGAGFVVLKRLQDARTHGNYVYAVLRGWGISSDGKGSMTAPKAEAQALAIRRAFGKAGYDISSVHFIEGHGTGTPAGDRAEVEAIAMAMEGQGQLGQLRSCGITSLKSLIGHTKAASGIGGFIKAVLAVNRRVIPPTAGCSEPNNVFHDKAKALFPVMNGEIHDAAEVMRAGISGMGFGGINCHVTIESAGQPASALEPSIGERELLASYQGTEIFPISAQNKQDMLNQLTDLKKLVYGISTAELTDLSNHLTQQIDSSNQFRIALIAGSPENLIDCLDRASQILSGEETIESVQSSPQQDIWVGHNHKAPRTGFLFPGQGSQQINMGKMIIGRYSWARDLLNEADIFVSGNGYEKIGEEIYPPVDRALDERQIEAWKKHLAHSEIAQPAICFASILWMRYLDRLGITPCAVGGHSLGELSAFYAAGAFTDMELIHFASFRGRITTARTCLEAGSMASLACDAKKAQAVLDGANGYAVIANINSPSQTVISGERTAIENALRRAAADGIKTRILPVANAFHSRFMSEAACKLVELASIPSHSPASSVRLFTSMDGSLVPHEVDMKQHFSRQLTHTVDFVTLINNMAKECDILFEVGPGRVLSDLTRAITASKGVYVFPVEGKAGDERSLNVALACYFAHGGAIKWPALFQNRLVRPFVPANKRIFIESLCERALLPVDDDTLKSIRIEKSQKVEQGTILSKLGGLAEHADGSVNTPDALLLLVSNVTGFPISSISLENRLLDDLNLDSIKAAELVAKAAKFYRAEGTVNPLGFANSTLREIYDSIATGKHKEKSISATRSKDAWVRNFKIIYALQPTEPKLHSGERQKNVLVVSDRVQDEINNDLGETLGQYNMLATSINYSQIPLDIPDEVGKYDHFIFLLPESHKETLLTAGEVLKMIGRLHKIAWTIAATKARSPKPTYEVVQFGGTDLFRIEPEASPESKGATSFIASLSQENPQERFRLLQFTHYSPLATGKMASELLTDETFSIAVYDKDFNRTVPVMTPIKSRDFQPRQLTWTSRDVILVTGGGKGITAKCALAFALKTGAKLALVGSTSAIENDHEVKENLKCYSENNIDHRYYACDVTDSNAVVSMVRRISVELGHITGVIHGAALNRPRRADQVTVDAAYEASGPKLLGAINILHALDTPPKLFAAFGSIIGITGVAGNAWYGFSNEALNLLIQQYKELNPATEIISCAFSIWDEVGMGAKMGSIEFLSKLGIQAIPKEKGVEHFIQLTTSTIGIPQVVVSSRLGVLDIMRSQPPTNRASFMEDILFFEKGVELDVKAVLTAENDKYLGDHVFKGTCLFPTVFGIEAMHQAVMAVAHVEDARVIEIEDINLNYPITVEPCGQTEIRIRALVQEPERVDIPLKVKVSVTAEKAGFPKDCFEAVFILNGNRAPSAYNAEIPKGKVDIDPSKDLYGHMLFQGPSFQRISHVWLITEHQCVFEALAKPPEPDFDRVRQPFTAGDPYFRDSLLQSVQIIRPDLVALPIRIEKWESFPKLQSVGIYNVIADIVKIDGDTIVSNVIAFNKNGTIIEKLLGYTVKIVERRQDSQLPMASKAPDQGDENDINRKIDLFCKSSNVTPPAICMEQIPDLSKMSKAERHVLEQKLLERACRAASPAGNGGIPVSIAVAWTVEGKPFLPENKNIGLSCAHDANLLICVAGPNQQGCDIETVTHREPEEWIIMLGQGNHPALDEMIKDGHSYDAAATRIWCAMETLLKASDMRLTAFSYKGTDGEFAIFYGGDDMWIITLPVRLFKGGERIFALMCHSDKNNSGRTLFRGRFGE